MKNKLVIVTGASSGIGKACAIEFAQKGANVVLVARSQSKLEELAVQISSYGVQVLSVVADVSREGDCKKMVEEVLLKFGKIDVLVNNASAFYPTPINNASLNDWDKLVGSNLKGPLFLIKGLHEIIANNNGSIINITDTNLTKGVANFSVYAAAKGGLESITKSLARELAPNINVNAIAPGAMLEPPDVIWSDEKKASVIENIPLKRMGSEKDIANAVKFLVKAKYITGQTIKVDGGRSLI